MRTIKILLLALTLPLTTLAQVKNVTTYAVERAHQGVTADGNYIYVINNTTIDKYAKAGGGKVNSFDGGSLGLKHMNSAILLNGQLVCAHSNFPDMPMASSVETFDAATLKHLSSYSFGIEYGSLTWAVWHQDAWWCCFANYSLEGFPHSNRYTTLVKFSKSWQKLGAWIFPKELTTRFGFTSCSGGVFVNDTELAVTGHDLPELYIVTLPQMGSTLVWQRTIQVPIRGQAIGVRQTPAGTEFYGIDGEKRVVSSFMLK